MNPTEQQIQQSIINFLKYKGYYVQRMNTGVIRSTYKGRDRMIRMSAKGTPDIMAFKVITFSPPGVDDYLDLLFIEVKRPGFEATFEQEQTMQELTAHGSRCLVAHSLEEVQNWI